MIDTDIWQKQVESLNADSYQVRCRRGREKAAPVTACTAAELAKQRSFQGKSFCQGSTAFEAMTNRSSGFAANEPLCNTLTGSTVADLDKGWAGRHFTMAVWHNADWLPPFTSP